MSPDSDHFQGAHNHNENCYQVISISHQQFFSYCASRHTDMDTTQINACFTALLACKETMTRLFQ